LSGFERRIAGLGDQPRFALSGKTHAQVLLTLALLLLSPFALAVSPYLYGERVGGGDLNTVMTTVESKLTRGL